jgi:hypothetical protein
MKNKPAVQVDTINGCEPILIKAGDTRLGIGRNFEPPEVDCRVLAETTYQKMKDQISETKTITYTEKDFKEMVNGWNEERGKLEKEKDGWRKECSIAEMKHYRLLGEFIGTLKGICSNEIPEELKEKLRLKIKELEGK